MAETLVLNMCDIDEPQQALRLAMDDEKLRELMASIREVGLIVPIRVKRVGERYEIVDGHRRWQAHRMMDALHIRAELEEGDDKLSEARKLHANLMREDNSDAEVAVWLKQLVDAHGYNEQQLVQLVRRSPDWIADRMRLLEGDEMVFRALAERQINFSVAKILNRCESPSYRQYYLDHAIRSNAPARVVDNWINSIPLEQPANGDASPAAAAETAAAPAGNGAIACEFCGGGLDPWNLKNVWVHPHEWALILKARDQGVQVPADA